MHSAIDLVVPAPDLDPDFAAAPAPAAGVRVAAMASDGSQVVISDGGQVRIAGGPALLEAARVVAAGAVDGATWLVTCDDGEHQLRRFDRSGAAIGSPAALGALGDDVVIASLRVGGRGALIEGRRGVVVGERDGELSVEPLGERGRDRRVLLGGRGVVERRGPQLAWLRRGALPGFALPFDLTAASVVSGAMVLDGAAALIELDRNGQRVALLYDVRRGEVRSRVRLGDAAILAVAERKGIVVLGRGASVAMFDLRASCCVGERILPGPLAACAIDALATRIVLVDQLGQVAELGASLSTALVAVATAPEATVVKAAPAAPVIAEAAPVAIEAAETVREGVETVEAATEAAEAAEAAPGATEAARPGVEAVEAAREAAKAAPTAEEVEREAALTTTTTAAASSETADVTVSDSIIRNDDALMLAGQLHLAALDPAPALSLSAADLDAYLADTRAWVDALCATALATAASAADALTAARAHEQAATDRLLGWTDPRAPHLELARELALSPTALTALLLIAAPQIWGELARGYGRCTDDPARPLVDELLLAHLLDAGTAERLAIARELDADAPLITSGAVELGRGLRPYAALSAHPAIARRLAGGARPSRDPAALALPAICGPRDAIVQLAHRLAVPASCARVVLRGRPGSGRRTLAAALAAQAGRRTAGVAVADLAGTPDLDATLRRRLRDAALRGELPCLDLDELADEPGLHSRVRGVLDAHPGALIVRAPSHGDLPLAPGYAGLDFPALSETERAAIWRDLLAARGHAPAAAHAIAGSLATRFAVGPGAMLRACRELPTGEPSPMPAATEHALAAALRQHRSARIAAVATRVTTLGSWDDLVVADDIADALREVCARVRHRRLVLESWGMERAAASAQGVTALFQGGPGTGKTMAAGVIARALGYELWRVDLSKVVSKWIGETEKNLAAVFDAAEQGEIVLLFDEADSLFAKRTQVSSSNDRNANLETNYLLQRLDSFTGIAVLTTNAGTAIDAAFKRRMSVHVQFPFPDEADRERLWRAHLPPSLPISGDLDLIALAHKHALSGGYIRNACLRAAYLAAADAGVLTERHLHRAVTLEYQRAGKLGGGRLE